MKQTQSENSRENIPGKYNRKECVKLFILAKQRNDTKDMLLMLRILENQEVWNK